jgi:hypothetical protein
VPRVAASSMSRSRIAAAQFNSIEGVNFTDAELTKYRSISLTTIATDPEGQAKIIAGLTWMEQQIEHSARE